MMRVFPLPAGFRFGDRKFTARRREITENIVETLFKLLFGDIADNADDQPVPG